MLKINLSSCPAQRELAQWASAEIAADYGNKTKHNNLWGKTYSTPPARCGLDGLLMLDTNEWLLNDFLWRIETELLSLAMSGGVKRFQRTLRTILHLSNNIRQHAGFETITRKDLLQTL